MCVVKQQPQKSHEQYILQNIFRSIDLCFLRDTFHELLCIFSDFYALVTLESEVTKSLVLHILIIISFVFVLTL